MIRIKNNLQPKQQQRLHEGFDEGGDEDEDENDGDADDEEFDGDGEEDDTPFQRRIFLRGVSGSARSSGIAPTGG